MYVHIKILFILFRLLWYFYSASSSPPLYSEGVPDTVRILSWSFTARAGFEPTTLRTIGVESTNKPLRPASIVRFGFKSIDLKVHLGIYGGFRVQLPPSESIDVIVA